ncbi:chromate efflux transporter [Phenylobacterium sp.]|uniref:chromate efflux transporter n=1 Tax=Phenylobacterium sp. TaxID=1871053 RepID=UPI002FDD8CAE
MSDPLHPPAFRELVGAFARIGCLSFGGPAGQVALIHREIVEERRWLDEDQFLHALNFCHLLPGPEAQQLATWIGWKLHGWRGGLAAGLLFVLPGALVILALSLAYVMAAEASWFAALFLGVKAAVLAIVLQALIRIGRRALDTGFRRGLAALAFLALFAFAVPFPWVVLAAGTLGALVAKARPSWLNLTLNDAPAAAPPWKTSLRSALLWGFIWAAPMVAVVLTVGPDHVLWRIGVFFSQLAVVTFGGAYAVLAYMAQEAVQGFGWLSTPEMADGLGLAETTPGPLILVTQFVGFLAAFRAPEPFTPLVAGLLGAGLTTWVTFAPCFLWIFTFAPWIDRLQASTYLRGALSALTASVVGAIASLSLWFALHVLFAQVGTLQAGPLRLPTPSVESLDGRAAILTIVALALVFGLKWGVLRVLASCAVGGLLLLILS